MNHRCKICGNIDGNIIYNVKERILNKGDVFAYLHCAHCGTLMLNEPIEDMSRWYAPDYNPFIKRRQREKYFCNVLKLREVMLSLEFWKFLKMR